MSGSFWKFGQDYANEAPLTKLLNKAFFKINNTSKASLREKKLKAADVTSESDSDCISGEEEDAGHMNRAIDSGLDQSSEDQPEGRQEGEENDEKTDDTLDEGEQEQVSISESNFEYKDYRPNLDILDDLLDDEELYTELMCSNFKLLVFFRYPEVLAKLVDYVTNEHVLEPTDEQIVETESDLDVDHDEVEPRDESPELEFQDAVSDEVDTKQQSSSLYSNTDNALGRKEEEQKSKNSPVSSSQLHSTLDVPDNASESSAETSITLPPESEEQAESRRARIAAEILSADVWTISSAFMDSEDLLAKLWHILEHPAPLSIIASTYFMKINERLLDMDINGMISFILKQEKIVDRFITHIDNPPLMDFLLKVISTDKPDAPTGIITLLKKQHLIPKLLDYLSEKHDSSIQSAAGDFLKALITISANSNNEIASAIGPNELTRELVSPEMVTKLVDIMLQGGTSLSNGVGIVIELIRKNNSDYDFVQVMYTTLETHPPTDRDPVYLGHLVRSFANRMDRFNQILVERKLDPLETPFGTIEPLGFERFKICELVAELLHCSNMGLLSEPSGEAIVRERDIKRQEFLDELEAEANEQSRDVGGDFSNVNVDQVPIESVQEELENLRMNTTSDEQNEAADLEDVEDAGNIDETDVSSSERSDIHSENSSESEVSEKALRENPVVGDLLKISLQDNNIITTILDMFFKFPWNNFLHNVVFDIVQQIFNGPLKSGYNRFLLADLFSSAHITDVIMKGDRDCVEHEKETGVRLGYMGHLTLIAEEVAKFAAYIDEADVTFSSPIVQDGLNEAKWKEYCDTILTETREKYSSLLGEDGIDEVENDDGDEEVYEEDDVINDNDKRFLNVNGSVHYDETDEEQESTELGENNCYVYEDAMGNKTKVEVRMEGDDGEGAYSSDMNKFINYMSNEIQSGRAMTENNEDEEGDEEDDIWNGPSSNTFQPQVPNKTFFNNSMFHSHQFDLSPDDEEDYLDPNDDGQSYAKPNHPLYSSMLSPGGIPYDAAEDELNDLDINDEVENENEADEEDDLDVDVAHPRRSNEYSLRRTSSNDKLSYDLTEQEGNAMGMSTLRRASSHDT